MNSREKIMEATRQAMQEWREAHTGAEFADMDARMEYINRRVMELTTEETREAAETGEDVTEETETETTATAEAQTTETETEEEEEEQTMKNPSFTIKCIQFHVDENSNKIGNPIIREFSGSSWKEAKAAWKAARDNNDVVKFSPLTIYDIINSEEE